MTVKKECFKGFELGNARSITAWKSQSESKTQGYFLMEIVYPDTSLSIRIFFKEREIKFPKVMQEAFNTTDFMQLEMFAQDMNSLFYNRTINDVNKIELYNMINGEFAFYQTSKDKATLGNFKDSAYSSLFPQIAKWFELQGKFTLLS